MKNADILEDGYVWCYQYIKGKLVKKKGKIVSFKDGTLTAEQACKANFTSLQNAVKMRCGID